MQNRNKFNWIALVQIVQIKYLLGKILTKTLLSLQRNYVRTAAWHFERLTKNQSGSFILTIKCEGIAKIKWVKCFLLKQ